MSSALYQALCDLATARQQRNTQVNDEHATMVEDCEKRESKLTDWERGFIDSLSRQLAAGRTLTEKQAETLDRIWERVT